MDHKIYKVDINEDKTIEAIFFDGSKKRYDITTLYDSFPEFKLLEDEEVRKKGQVDNMRTHIKWDYNISLDSDTIWEDGVLIEMVNISDPHIRLAYQLMLMRDTRKVTQKELGVRSGVTQADISRFERGEGNPSLDTMAKLASALEYSMENIFTAQKIYPEIYPSDIFQPYLKKLKRQGEYTVEDIMDIPEDIRVELIDGVIYDLAVPSRPHQFVVSDIEYAFMDYIKKNKGKCRVWQNYGVTSKKDDRNYLVPDMTVTCERDGKGWEEQEVPDFVLEVVSPGNGKRDYTIKLTKYKELGVREYWIVDIKKRMVMVYFFEKEDSPSIYPIDSKIGVGIYNNELIIDMEEIMKESSEYFADKVE